MVFSGLLGASKIDTSTKNKTSSSAPTLRRNMSSSFSLNGEKDKSCEYITDEAQLLPLADDPPDLRELNNSLEALAAIFPDVQVEVFREMLSSFDQESRLAVVADALLKNRVGWVKGRWRTVGAGDKTEDTNDPKVSAEEALAPAPATDLLVPTTEAFRSPEYIRAAKNLAWHEFKGLSRSTINAVLAESNYSYLHARNTLVSLSSKSWKFTIHSLFYRRKPVTSTEAENHPLVIWRSSGNGSILPSLKATGNAELDRELYKELVLPLNMSTRLTMEEQDRVMAMAMNTEEAEAHNETYECCCCFTTATFEEFTSCNAEGHLICVRCVQLSISEAIFGQGWIKTINKENGTLRCPAVPTGRGTESKECEGCIPFDQLHRAVMEGKRGAEVMLKLEQRLANHSLVSSGLPVIRCPFCEYAEVDEVYLPADQSKLRIKVDNLHNVVFIFLCIIFTPFLLSTIVFSFVVAILVSSKQTLGDTILEQFKASLTRHRRHQRGLKYTCQSPACGRKSCIACEKEWFDIHVCNESSLVALRTQVEQAMSMAIKRVCPRCNASFVKTAGCNKMTCQCGYKMCYVCRADIGGTEGDDVGYRHFCQHFRPHGDGSQCKSCVKCNLWQNEDSDAVLKQAKEEAERKWMEVEKRQLSAAETAFLETGVASQGRSRGVENALVRGKLPTITDVCDMIIENLVA